MHQIARSRSIAAPTGVIWGVLADFGAIASWAPNAAHSELITTLTEGPGTTRRVQAGRTVLLETVTDWQPGSALAYAITGLPRVVRSVQNRWQLTAIGDRAEVQLTSTVDAGPRPPQQLIAAVVARVLARTSDALLDGLRTHVEELSR